MTGSSRSATAARPRIMENMNGITNLLPTLVSKWWCTLGSSLPIGDQMSDVREEAKGEALTI